MKEKVLIREMIIKYKPKKCTSCEIINSPEKVWSFMKEKIGDETQETFCGIYLDRNNAAIGYAVIFKGTVTESIAHPRDIFKIALLANACSIILIHNHPSGTMTPSSEDIKTTESLIEASKLMGIQILDHVIISEDSYYSFKEEGMINGISKI